MRQYVPKTELCSKCGRDAPVHKRDGNLPLCRRCYKVPSERCHNCDKVKEVYKRENGQALCRGCHARKYRSPEKVCDFCGASEEISQNLEDGRRKCVKCYAKEYYKGHEYPIKNCSVCGKPKHIRRRTENSLPLCDGCYMKAHKATNQKFKIICNLRIAFRKAFNNYSSSGKIWSSKEYGIDYESILAHLGQCPGNLSDYHIDHIVPLCLFDFDNLVHIKAAFAPENHQWLRKSDNLSKGDLCDEKQFQRYLAKFQSSEKA